MAPYEVHARMQELFPVDHPASAWLLRLMVIRDDLEFEYRSLGLKPDDGTEEVWRCSYFLRRIATSIFEARGILEQDVGKASARPADEAMKLLAPFLKEVIEVVKRAANIVTPIRNALSAHIRPQNADSALADVTRQVLSNHPALAGAITIEPTHFAATSYRALTSAFLSFAWPHADDDESILRCHTELSEAIHRTVPELLHAIDALLVRHWMVLGILKPPEGYDFAFREHKTGDLVRVILKAPGGAA